MAIHFPLTLVITSVNSIRVALALVLLCNVSFAQDTTKKTTMPVPLEALTGFTQKFYYSAGHEARAKNIALFLEDAGHYFQSEVGYTPVTTIYILAPQHWKGIAAKPLREVYGFPHNIDHARLAIAAEDNDFWRSFVPAVDQLTPQLATQVATAYGKPGGSYSMMPFFDLLALHEMGHSYTAQAGLKMHRYWMGELFVNIMLHTYVAEKQPALLPALEVFPNLVAGSLTTTFKFTSLEDFERLYTTLGMGPENYGWYQCKLHIAAKHIYNAAGKKVLIDLWKALKKHQEEMPDETFVKMLKEEVHPAVAAVYLKWNKADH